MLEVVNWVIVTIFVIAMFGVFEIRYVRMKIKFLKGLDNEVKQFRNVREQFTRLLDAIQAMDRDKMD